MDGREVLAEIVWDGLQYVAYAVSWKRLMTR
jgi:hypothetical protein